jgi:site-specific DNA-methyltransferase (adenine-specific)
MLAAGERFTLAYLDPPFFTGRDFETADGQPAYSDKWDNFETYLNATMVRAELAFALLDDSGSLVIHVDPTVSHYVKVSGDRLFGARNFESEIVWRYRRWPAKCSNFQRMHDVLLRWVKGRLDLTWNQLYEPLSQATVETWANRSQHARFDRAGKRRSSVATAEESPGAALSDVWEISVVPSGRAAGSERTGYPTQKPEKLIERLVLALTNEGDRVLSPYMGSGTELAVCHRLGRKCTGIDSSEVAVNVARQRLARLEAQGSLFTDMTTQPKPHSAESTGQ